jgi:hypothetical protein
MATLRQLKVSWVTMALDLTTNTGTTTTTITTGLAEETGLLTQVAEVVVNPEAAAEAEELLQQEEMHREGEGVDRQQGEEEDLRAILLEAVSWMMMMTKMMKIDQVCTSNFRYEI